MKKLVSVVLLLALALCLAGCGSEKSKVVINSISDLKGTKVGVQLGTTGDIYVSDDDSIGVASVERYNKGFEAVQALIQGKIDAVVIDDQPAQVFVKQNKGLKILDEEYTVEDYAICISKENTELLNKINAALAKIKSNGVFDGIVDYYIGQVDGAKRYQADKTLSRENGTLVMATNAEFQPYEYKDNNEILGLDVDMAQAIADELNMTLKVEDMAFDSIIAAVQSGKASIGVAGMTVTEERLLSINFSDSYYQGRQVIIAKDAK